MLTMSLSKSGKVAVLAMLLFILSDSSFWSCWNGFVFIERQREEACSIVGKKTLNLYFLFLNEQWPNKWRMQIETKQSEFVQCSLQETFQLHFERDGCSLSSGIDSSNPIFPPKRKVCTPIIEILIKKSFSTCNPPFLKGEGVWGSTIGS